MNTDSIIRDKWDCISKNYDILKSIMEECKKHSEYEGGLMYLKYENAEDTTPMGVFVPKSDSETWSYLKSKIVNFESLEKEYDVKKHCLMLLTIPGACQLVRIVFSNVENISSVGDTTWSFNLD